MASKMGLQDGVLKSMHNIRGRLAQPGRNTKVNQEVSLGTFRRAIDTGTLNVGIVRSLGGIGDVLMTTPSLRAIKSEWPNCNITYGTDFNYANGALKDLLKHNPYIDDLVPYHIMSRGNFDTLIDVTSCCVKHEKPGVKSLNRIDLFAKTIGVSLDNTGHKPDIILTPDEQHWAEQKMARIKTRGNQITIGIQPSSSVGTRTWPLDKVKQLVVLLSQNPKYKIIVFDWHKGNVPGEPWNFSNVAPIINYNIRQVAALMQRVDFMVTPDSGLMHLAAALDIPTLAIFGGTDPDARVNLYPRTDTICSSHYACHPCWYSQEACNNTNVCLTSITVDTVFDKTNELVRQYCYDKAPTEIVPMMKETYCIVRDDGIGDLIACLPAFSAFKKANKNKKIMLATLTRNRDIMMLSGCFDGIIPLATKWENFHSHSKVYDARDLFEKHKESGRSGCYHESKPRPVVMADYLGVKPDKNYVFPQDHDTITKAKTLLSQFGIQYGKDKIVILQLQATCKTRSWPNKFYKVLPRLIHECGYIPVALGAKHTGEFDVFSCVNLTGRTDIMVFNALIALSNAMVGVDSGGLHLAAANKIPFVGIYNAIDPGLRLHGYSNYRAMYPDSLDCTPCWDQGCEEMKCMQLITPEKVINALQDLMKNQGATDIIRV